MDNPVTKSNSAQKEWLNVSFAYYKQVKCVLYSYEELWNSDAEPGWLCIKDEI